MSNLTRVNEHIQIDQGRLLGRGTTGNVYLGHSLRHPHKKYAVKAIKLSKVNNEVTRYLLQCEKAALSQLTKLNISSVVKLQDTGANQEFFYLVMELLEGGSLSSYIKDNPDGICEQQAMHIFRQLLGGYKAIKGLGVVHRDIKPDNLMFRQKYDRGQYKPKANSKNICFIDFGYCAMQKVGNRPKVSYNVGSPKYMAPQAYSQKTYSQKSDIWALGVILYEMVHGSTIGSGMTMAQYINFLRNNPIPVDPNLSQLIKKLLLRMLTFDHDKRMSCTEIQQLFNSSQSIQQSFPQINQSQHQSLSKQTTHPFEYLYHPTNGETNVFLASQMNGSLEKNQTNAVRRPEVMNMNNNKLDVNDKLNVIIPNKSGNVSQNKSFSKNNAQSHILQQKIQNTSQSKPVAENQTFGQVKPNQTHNTNHSFNALDMNFVGIRQNVHGKPGSYFNQTNNQAKGSNTEHKYPNVQTSSSFSPTNNVQNHLQRSSSFRTLAPNNNIARNNVITPQKERLHQMNQNNPVINRATNTHYATINHQLPRQNSTDMRSGGVQNTLNNSSSKKNGVKIIFTNQPIEQMTSNPHKQRRAESLTQEKLEGMRSVQNQPEEEKPTSELARQRSPKQIQKCDSCCFCQII